MRKSVKIPGSSGFFYNSLVITVFESIESALMLPPVSIPYGMRKSVKMPDSLGFFFKFFVYIPLGKLGGSLIPAQLSMVVACSSSTFTTPSARSPSGKYTCAIPFPWIESVDTESAVT